MRKIVHVQVSSANLYHVIFALCDDGTLWVKKGEEVWKQIATSPVENAK